VVRWIERMDAPRAEGGFEPWSKLEPTLLPFLAAQIGALFLPWSDANARALAKGLGEFRVELPTGPWTQAPQKYHAKSLAALRARYAAARSAELDAVLERAGCLRWLQAH
jgi:hypothetical protein